MRKWISRQHDIHSKDINHATAIPICDVHWKLFCSLICWWNIPLTSSGSNRSHDIPYYARSSVSKRFDRGTEVTEAEAAPALTQAGSDPLPPCHTPSKSLAPIPMSGFWRWDLGCRSWVCGCLCQESSPQEIITVRYFPDFSRTPGSKGKGLVRKSRIATDQHWRETSCRRILRGSCWKSTVSST